MKTSNDCHLAYPTYWLHFQCVIWLPPPSWLQYKSLKWLPYKSLSIWKVNLFPVLYEDTCCTEFCSKKLTSLQHNHQAIQTKFTYNLCNNWQNISFSLFHKFACIDKFQNNNTFGSVGWVGHGNQKLQDTLEEGKENRLL